MIDVVPASPRHIGSIAANIRAVDALECAAFGSTPKASLRRGLSTSLMCATARLDGQPQAMFGVATVSLAEGLGRPWLLGTDVVPRCGPALMRLGRRYLAVMHRWFPRLENWVAVENVAAVAWLKHLGFAFDAEPIDCRGVAMVRFERRVGDV